MLSYINLDIRTYTQQTVVLFQRWTDRSSSSYVQYKQFLFCVCVQHIYTQCVAPGRFKRHTSTVHGGRWFLRGSLKENEKHRLSHLLSDFSEG